MMKMFDDERKMRKIYNHDVDNCYSFRFFEDISAGFKYALGDGEQNFFSVEPEMCLLKKLLLNSGSFSLSVDLEKLIHDVARSLVSFGKAYVLIYPEYITDADDKRILNSICIREVQGFKKRQAGNVISFCCKTYNGIKNVDINEMQLISFSLTDMGYKRKYFRRILKKLGRYDITRVPNELLCDQYNYDFNLHRKRSKFNELKTVKGLGWSFGQDGLSDSYILYKKIQGDMFKIKLLNYILLRINEKLAIFLNDDSGKIVSHIVKKDYDKLWRDYTNGKISCSQLSNTLYH